MTDNEHFPAAPSLPAVNDDGARNLARLVARIERRINEDCHVVAHQHGLTGSELKVLVIMADAVGAPVDPSLLYALPGESPVTINRLTERLVAKNCIERARDDGDRRKLRLILTQEGCDRVIRFEPALSARLSRHTSELSAEEKSQLAMLLGKVLGNDG